MKTACVFAHYDKDGIVDNYVLYYLESLRVFVEKIVFVTTANLDTKCLEKVESLGISTIKRENVGYDFLSYKVGMSQLCFDEYDELILCNDSVYGPFTDLRKLFRLMRERRSDFWGMTESYRFGRHLQSYFLVFERSVIDSAAFRKFWSDVSVLTDKNDVIYQYEVGLSKRLAVGGFSYAAYASFENTSIFRRLFDSRSEYLALVSSKVFKPRFLLSILAVLLGIRKLTVDSTHLEWKVILTKLKVPFLKVSLLRDNPLGLSDLNNSFEAIRSLGVYPVDLISSHLSRVNGAQLSSD